MPSFENFLTGFLSLMEHGATPHQAWEYFVTHPWIASELKIVARRSLRATEKAIGDDVEQEVVLRLLDLFERRPYLGLDRAYSPEQIQSFILMVLKRYCWSARWKIVEAERLQGGRLVGLTWVDPRVVEPIENLIREESDERVQQVIAQLSPTLHQVLLLRSKGLTLAEIARRLGVSVSSAHRWDREIRQVLAQSLYLPRPLPVTDFRNLYVEPEQEIRMYLREFNESLQSCLAEFEGRTHHVLTLRFLDDLTITDIAERLLLDRRTVARILDKALPLLRDCLRAKGFGD